MAGIIEGGEFIAVKARRVECCDPVNDDGCGGDVDEDGSLARPRAQAGATSGEKCVTGGHAESDMIP
jgi:hypothetical protein